jgi:hypothetical protein
MRISPAALWHAKALKIDISLIRGSGPKGYILKSDILQSKNLKLTSLKSDISQSTNLKSTSLKSDILQQPQLLTEVLCDFQLLVPCSLSEDLVIKGVSRALSLCSLENNSNFSFHRIPDFGIQIKISASNPQSTEKLQKIIPLLLKDPHFLLL